MANRPGRLDPALPILGLLAALACAAPAPLHAEPQTYSDAERKFVIKTLNQLQKLSFRYDREYCGFIGYTPQGKLTTGMLSQGDLDTCLPIKPKSLDVVASFHTHGGFGTEHWSEIPSLTDVESDNSGGNDGWVSTPGGRLWFINGKTRYSHVVCGPRCLITDPRYQPNVPGPVSDAYSYEALRAFMGE